MILHFLVCPGNADGFESPDVTHVSAVVRYVFHVSVRILPVDDLCIIRVFGDLGTGIGQGKSDGIADLADLVVPG